MPSHRAAVALALLLASVAQGNAQDVREREAVDSPEAVVRSLFAALDADRWSDAADLYHPDSLEVWHRRAVGEMERMNPPPPEELVRRMHPELTGAAADSAARALQEPFEFGWRMSLSRRFAGIESIEDLRELSIRESAARALEAASPDYQRDHALRTLEEGIRGDEVDPERREEERARMREDLLSGIPLERERVVEGTVRSGDRAYVVYRVRFRSEGGVPGPDNPTLVPLIRAGDDWKVVPQGTNLLDEPGPFRVTRGPIPGG